VLAESAFLVAHVAHDVQFDTTAVGQVVVRVLVEDVAARAGPSPFVIVAR